MSHATKPRRRALSVLAAALLLSGGLAGCAGTAPGPAASPSSAAATDGDFLAAHGLEGLDAVKVIERLDTMAVADRPTDLLASVRPDALVLTDAQERSTQLAMPEDEVYISVAPYRDQTHECHFHSLTTCLGELPNTEVQVKLTDTDGRVLIDEAERTYDNGFLGIWVPRGTEATLTIEHEGRTGTAELSTTSADDATCITTLQLT